MVEKDFRAERGARTSTITLNGGIEKVFPLFGAIDERKWAEGWNPIILYPPAEKLEAGMVFMTESDNRDESRYAWIVSAHHPDTHMVEYTVSTVNRVWVIKIQCTAASASETEASVTYTFTGLNQLGNELNKKHIAQLFARNLEDWEVAIDYYLETGNLMKAR